MRINELSKMWYKSTSEYSCVLNSKWGVMGCDSIIKFCVYGCFWWQRGERWAGLQRLSKDNQYLCIVQEFLTNVIFMYEIIKSISMAICTLLHCAFQKVTSFLTCKSYSAFFFIYKIKHNKQNNWQKAR